MHCNHCSAVADTGAAFCGKCGTKLGFTEDIILAAIAKEENAITYLYNETYNSVFQAIRPLIKDEDTALDILQDTYIKAFDSLEQLEKPEQFRAWVKRIAQNKSKDWLKKKKPTLFSEMRPDDESGEIDFLDEREFAQPDVTLDKEETRRLLWEIIDSLSDEQRLVVSMYYFQEMQVKEIALELGISENTVKSRLNYARKNIESKVLVLEKQGTKLYSLAPLPFLLWLIRSTAEIPSAAALTEITGALGASGAAASVSSAGGTASSAGTAASSGTAAGAAAAGASLVTKIIVGIVAAAIAVGGGIALYQTLTPDGEPAEVVSGFEETQDSTDATTEPELDFSPEPELALEELNAERIAAYVSYVEGITVDNLFHYAYKYILYDVDGDGLYELLATNHSDFTLESYVFTVDEAGELLPLYYAADGDGGGRAWVEFVMLEYQGQKYLAHSYSDGGGYGIYNLLNPEDGSLEVVHKLEQGAGADVGAVEVIEGAITRDEFISTYKNAATIPDATSDNQIDYAGYSDGKFRIDAVGEVIRLTYTTVIVDVVDRELKKEYIIYGIRTDNVFVMERVEVNDNDNTSQYDKFDFAFYEDRVELTIVMKYPVTGLPHGTYTLTK